MAFADELQKVVVQVNRVLPAVVAVGNVFDPSDDSSGTTEADIRAGQWNGSGPVNPELARRDAPTSLNDVLIGRPVDAAGQPTRGAGAQPVSQLPAWFAPAAALGILATVFLAFRR